MCHRPKPDPDPHSTMPPPVQRPRLGYHLWVAEIIVQPPIRRGADRLRFGWPRRVVRKNCASVRCVSGRDQIQTRTQGAMG
jgi:hypothetical protein